MSSLTWLGKIPRIAIYLLIFAVMIVPLYFPWNLPISTSEEIQIMYDHLESLQPGDTVMFLHMMSPTFWGEFQHMFYAVIQHLFVLEDVTLIGVPIRSAMSQSLLMETIDRTTNPLNKEYGTDYALLTLIPALEAGGAQLAADFRGSFTTDEFGTPLDDIPAMDGINTISDFDVVIWFEMARFHFVVPRFVYPAHPNVVYFGGCGGEGFMFMAPYMGAPYKSGMIGVRGAAEYQALTRNDHGTEVTEAISQMDALSGYHLLGVILVIFGNIAYFVERSRKPGGS